MMEYIYFISDNHGHMKVGKAKEPYDRLKNLQCGNPYELEIRDLIEVVPHESAGFDAICFESMIHRELSKHKIRNEWFLEKPVEEWLQKIRKDAFTHPKSKQSFGCFHYFYRNSLWVFKIKLNMNVTSSTKYKLYVCLVDRK